METRLYNFDPLKPHFYIVKLGFKGVYIIFLISAQYIDCGYSLEPPLRGGSNEYPQSMFWAEIWKIFEFFVWKFSIFSVINFSVYLNKQVFVMCDRLIYWWLLVYIRSNLSRLGLSKTNFIRVFNTSEQRFVLHLSLAVTTFDYYIWALARHLITTFGPQCQKTYLLTCDSNNDSNQSD